jgi:flagellar basal-body rod protein FlgB
MFDRPSVMSLAATVSAHAAARQSVIARNVANADTPGYRALDLAPPDFAQVQGAMRATRPGHIPPEAFAPASARPVQTGSGELSPNGNDVSLENELVKAAGIRREYDLALTVYKTSLDLLRSSLGRK